MNAFSCVYCGGYTTQPIVCAYCSQWSCNDCVVCDEDECGGWLCECCATVLGGGLEESDFDDCRGKVG